MSLTELSLTELALASRSVDPGIWPVGLEPDPVLGPLAASASCDLRVPLVTGEHVRYVNLDVAASAPCLDAVQTVVAGAQRWYSSVHRGAGLASAVSTEALAQSRRIIADFVGARHDDAVVITRHTTDALNLLASVLPEDTTVVTFASEHHANLLAWRRADTVVLPTPTSPQDALHAADRALASLRAGWGREESGRPLLLAVTGASNVTGEVWPIRQLAAVAHRHGARIVVDAAQLAPHRRIEVAADGLDYVALSGHKLYAPYGAGALIGRADWLDAGEPYLAGGGAVRVVTSEHTEWTTGPARHEAGTPNVLGAVALAAACRELERLGFDELHRHEASLAQRLRAGLEHIDGVQTYTAWGEATGPQDVCTVDRIGVVVFNLDRWHHGLLAAVLSAEHGIGVRDGAFCAHRLVDELVGDQCAAVQADPDAHPGAVRVSIGATTSVDDVDRLLAALRAIRDRGAAVPYEVRDGRHVPSVDGRVTPDLFAPVR